MTAFSDPMVDALTSLAADNYHSVETDTRKRGQRIPIPGECMFVVYWHVHFHSSVFALILHACVAVFYLSFIITPLCSNASEIVSSLIFASKRKRVNTSMTFSQV